MSGKKQLEEDEQCYQELAPDTGRAENVSARPSVILMDSEQNDSFNFNDSSMKIMPGVNKNDVFAEDRLSTPSPPKSMPSGSAANDILVQFQYQSGQLWHEFSLNELKRRHKYEKTTVQHLKEEYFSEQEQKTLKLHHKGRELPGHQTLDQIDFEEYPTIIVAGLRLPEDFDMTSGTPNKEVMQEEEIKPSPVKNRMVPLINVEAVAASSEQTALPLTPRTSVEAIKKEGLDLLKQLECNYQKDKQEKQFSASVELETLHAAQREEFENVSSGEQGQGESKHWLSTPGKHTSRYRHTYSKDLADIVSQGDFESDPEADFEQGNQSGVPQLTHQLPQSTSEVVTEIDEEKPSGNPYVVGGNSPAIKITRELSTSEVRANRDTSNKLEIILLCQILGLLMMAPLCFMGRYQKRNQSHNVQAFIWGMVIKLFITLPIIAMFVWIMGWNNLGSSFFALNLFWML